MDSPPKKKIKTLQKFKPEYTSVYPFLKPCKDVHKAFCNICLCEIHIGHGGIHDIKRHIETEKHKKLTITMKSDRRIDGFFTKTDEEVDSVTRAEALFTNFLVEHNIPLAVSDHFSRIATKMFPDSEIAKKYACGRTKSSAIVGALAQNDCSKIVEVMRNEPFSLSTDGSNDYSDHKLYPILVKYFDNVEGKVFTVVLSIPETTVSTGQEIFNCINLELEKYQLSWTNCVCFSADNANVMQGLKKGVAAFIKQANPAVYIMPCGCHLMHLAAEKAAKELPIHVEELLIDIYYYLDKSSKRQHELKNFQELFGAETKKIIKHVSTRWLSLGICIRRLLQQWKPLQAYFDEEYSQECKRLDKQTLRKEKSEKKDGKCAQSIDCAKHDESGTSNRDKSGNRITSEMKKPSQKCTDEKLVHEKGKTDTKIQTKSLKEAEKIKGKTQTNEKCEAQGHLDSNTTSSKNKDIDSGFEKRSLSDKSSKEKSQAVTEFDITNYLFDQKKMGEKAKKHAQKVSSTKAKSDKTSSTKITPEAVKTSSTKAKAKSDISSTKHTSDKTSSTKAKSDKPSPRNEKPESEINNNSITKMKQKKSEEKPKKIESRVQRVYRMMHDANTKAYALFLKVAVPLFDGANTLLQTESPQIHKLRSTLLDQLIALLSKFMKPDVVKQYKDNIQEIPCSRASKQKLDEDIFIGDECREYLNSVDSAEINKSLFYTSVRNYYVAAVSYMLTKFPYDEPVLIHAEVADIKKRTAAKFTSVKYFVKQFPCLNVESIDNIESEFSLYQIDEFPEDVENYSRIDVAWHVISQMKDEHSQLKYGNLAHVMKLILTIFHSNADSERIFSYVTKNSTNNRANMSTQTLSDLMVHKQFMVTNSKPCYEQTFSSQFLKKAKSSTYEKQKAQREMKKQENC